MTIKEMEGLSGMTRANIRFYESEGLLAPARSANGYRDYSENDLEILKRIKLLRSLHISLEEIKETHTGKHELLEVLNRQLEKLERERVDVERSQEVCEEMRRDRVSYQTLDAERYLSAMGQEKQSFTADEIPKVQSPWRRFFARSLDSYIYNQLWMIFLIVVFHVNILNLSRGDKLGCVIVTFCMMLFLEPLLLSRFGTTIGKWILGLSVTHNEDRRLSYTEALERTWMVLWRGMGLEIPIYALVRQWRSYTKCEDGETLEWEYDSMLTLRDEKYWRIGAWIGADVVLFALFMVVSLRAGVPNHRGDITVPEFCENYNALSAYHDVAGNRHLSKNGRWIEEGHTGTIDVLGLLVEYPDFVFKETDGVMTGMKFTVTVEGDDGIRLAYKEMMAMAVQSFVGAQEDGGLFSAEALDQILEATEPAFQDFSFSLYGISVSCDYEYTGYHMSSLDILYTDEAESDFFMEFVMEKEN